MLFEEKFIFIPVKYPEGDWEPKGIRVEEVWLTAADGVRIHAWFCLHPNAVGVVHWSHGNTGNISHRADEVRVWQQHLPLSILLYDYRGYGKSEGSPSEAGLYADARAAYDWLVQHQGVPPERVVLFGRSLGTAVALQLALEVPHACLILESAFTSAAAMGEWMFPWLPIGRFLRNRFESDQKIQHYRGRLYMIHGTADSVVPMEMGRRLFEMASPPKDFFAVEGADHTNVPVVGGKSYFRRLCQWLAAAGLPVASYEPAAAPTVPTFVAA